MIIKEKMFCYTNYNLLFSFHKYRGAIYIIWISFTFSTIRMIYFGNRSFENAQPSPSSWSFIRNLHFHNQIIFTGTLSHAIIFTWTGIRCNNSSISKAFPSKSTFSAIRQFFYSISDCKTCKSIKLQDNFLLYDLIFQKL